MLPKFFIIGKFNIFINGCEIESSPSQSGPASIKQIFLQYFIFSTNTVVRFLQKLVFFCLSYYIKNFFIYINNFTYTITTKELLSDTIYVHIKYISIFNKETPAPFAFQRFQKCLSVKNLSVSFQYSDTENAYPVIKPFCIDIDV